MLTFESPFYEYKGVESFRDHAIATLHTAACQRVGQRIRASIDLAEGETVVLTHKRHLGGQALSGSREVIV